MNRFGRLFSISIFGASHGKSVGVLIDGCPAGIPVTPEDFQEDLARRKPGAKGTTKRIEDDQPVLETGIHNGFTSGAPILIRFENKNTITKDYSQFKDQPRPGHADFTSNVKFGGFADQSGGGQFSGRLTLGLVAAGVIAKKIIAPATTKALLVEAGGLTNIELAINKAIASGDSIGGIIECRAFDLPVGLGEPFFDSIESVISHLVFSVPAIKGIEFGSGFNAAQMYGSEHNDTIINEKGKTKTNYSGGINGGISNGNELMFHVAVKPTSSVSKAQETFNFKSNKVEELKITGRHDTCIALRIPVIIESVAAIALADFMLISQQRPRIWNNKKQ